MRGGSRLVGWLWRWHRRLGLLAALFALMLATTGIVLNHSSELGLDRQLVGSPLLRGVYGDNSAYLPAYKVGGNWLFRAANGRVYLDGLEVAPCRGQLVGALRADGLLYAACAEELLLLTQSGELVESVTASTGLPVAVTGAGLVEIEPGETRVAVQSGNSWWLADLEQMDFGETAAGGSFIRQLAPGRLPATIRNSIPAQEDWLNWERLLLDLHSGRLFGLAGVLAVDAAGLLLGSLALSGVAMWWLHRRRRRKH